jgi:hypothetical protein
MIQDENLTILRLHGSGMYSIEVNPTSQEAAKKALMDRGWTDDLHLRLCEVKQQLQAPANTWVKF